MQLTVIKAGQVPRWRWTGSLPWCCFPLQGRAPNDRFFTTRPIILFNQVRVCPCFLKLAPTHFSNSVKPCILFSDNLSFSNLSRWTLFFFWLEKIKLCHLISRKKIYNGNQTQNTICMQRELNYWKSTLASSVVSLNTKLNLKQKY